MQSKIQIGELSTLLCVGVRLLFHKVFRFFSEILWVNERTYFSTYFHLLFNLYAVSSVCLLSAHCAAVTEETFCLEKLNTKLLFASRFFLNIAFNFDSCCMTAVMNTCALFSKLNIVTILRLAFFTSLKKITNLITMFTTLNVAKLKWIFC